MQLSPGMKSVGQLAGRHKTERHSISNSAHFHGQPTALWTVAPYPPAATPHAHSISSPHSQRLAPPCGLAPKHGQPQLSLSTCGRPLEEPLPEFDSIADALTDLAAGKFIVVLDDEDRENEGDLIIAADKITPAAMHFMVEYTSGVICICMDDVHMRRLKLPLMVSSEENEEAMRTAFTVTVDLKAGTTTGISATDRSATIRRLAEPDAQPEEFNRPGHIFPLRARAGGVLVRPGHTEASVDLARLAGCAPFGVLCEIVDKRDGSMARKPELLQFAKQHGLKCVTVADLVRYRLRHDPQLLVSTTSAPPAVLHSRHGDVTAHVFRSQVDNSEHVAFVVAGPGHANASGGTHEGVLTHIVFEHGLADLVGGASTSGCQDSGSNGSSNGSHGNGLHHAAAVPAASASGRPSAAGQEGSAISTSLDAALRSICSSESGGVAVYIRSQHRRGLSLTSELQALLCAAAPYQPNLWDYGLAAAALRNLGVESVRLSGCCSQHAAPLACCGVQLAGGSSSGKVSRFEGDVATAAAGGSKQLAGML